MGRASQYDSPQELTPREREVRELLRLGLTDVEIAQRLSISKSAVGHHVSAIMAKLRVANRYEAAYWPERPPWSVPGVALAGTLWKRGGLALSGSKVSSAALALSGGAFLATLGVLALIAALLVSGSSELPPSAPASASIESGTTTEQLEIIPAAEAPALATPSSNEPEPPPATATPASQPAPSNSLPTAGELPAGEVPNTPLPPANSPSTPTPTEAATPGPPQVGVMAVDCDAVEPGVQQDCSYELDALFRLQVHIIRAPEFGYAYFKVKLQWDAAGLAYLPAANPAEEGLWASCDWQKRNGITSETLSFACIPDPFPETEGKEIGSVLEFQFRCHENGAVPIVLAVVPLDSLDPRAATHFLDRHLNPLGAATNGARVTCGA